MTVFALHYMLKHGMRPFTVEGRMDCGSVGRALSWMTPDMASALRGGGGNPGIFTRGVLTVEPVRRGTQDARFAGIDDWLFDMWEAQDRRSNGGPPLDP